MNTSLNGLLSVRSLNTIARVLGFSSGDSSDLDTLTIYDLYYFHVRIFNNRYCTNRVKAEITDLLNTFGLL